MPRILVSKDTLEMDTTTRRPPSDSTAVGFRQGLSGRLYSPYRLEVGFTSEATNDDLLDLGSDIGMEWLLKRGTGDQKYDDAVLAAALSFTRYAEGDNYYYAGVIDLSAPVFEKLLGVDFAEQREQVRVQCVSDVAGSLNLKYFDLFHGDGDTDFTRVVLYNGTGDLPASGGGTLLVASYTNGDGSYDIAQMLVELFDLDDDWTVSVNDDAVTFDAIAATAKGFHHPRNSGFTVTTMRAGMAGAGQLTDQDSVTLLGELSFEVGGERQIVEIFNFVLENTLRRPGSTNPGSASGSNVRRGSAEIADGVSEVEVTFATPLSSAAWTFRDLQVINTTDATPQNIFPGIVTARSAAGFTVQLNGDTDSENYVLEYTCEL